MSNQKKPWQVDVLERLPVGMSVDALPWPTNLTIVLVDPQGNLHDGEKVSLEDLPPGSMELVRTLATDGKHVWKKTQVNPALSSGPIFEIMPRDPQAKGLNFQAGIYIPTDYSHKLIAEAYITADAVGIADAMAVLFCPQLEEITADKRSYSVVIEGCIFQSSNLWDALHKAAEWLREDANPRLKEYRAQTMADKGLKGDWGKWE